MWFVAQKQLPVRCRFLDLHVLTEELALARNTNRVKESARSWHTGAATEWSLGFKRPAIMSVTLAGHAQWAVFKIDRLAKLQCSSCYAPLGEGTPPARSLRQEEGGREQPIDAKAGRSDRKGYWSGNHAGFCLTSLAK